MTGYTLENGKLCCAGKPSLYLSRAQWGEGAPSVAEIAVHEAEIVARLNAFPAMLAALQNALPWLEIADSEGTFDTCALPFGVKVTRQRIRDALSAATGTPTGATVAAPPTSEAAERVTMVCEHCGSDNVTYDATAYWDVDAQAWALSDCLQNSDCQDCGRENCVIERPVGTSE